MAIRNIADTPISKLRRKLGLTQQELVAECEHRISRPYLSEIEMGHITPGKRTRTLLLHHLTRLAGKTITARSMKWE